MVNENDYLVIQSAIEDLNDESFKKVKNIIDLTNADDIEFVIKVLQLLAKYENQYAMHSKLFIDIIKEINFIHPKTFLQHFVNLFNCHTLRSLYQIKVFTIEEITELPNISDSVRIALAPEFNTPSFTKLLLPNMSMRRFHYLKQNNWKMFKILLEQVFLNDTLEYLAIHGDNSGIDRDKCKLVRDELIPKYSNFVSYDEFVCFYGREKPKASNKKFKESEKATEIYDTKIKLPKGNYKNNNDKNSGVDSSKKPPILQLVQDDYLFEHGYQRPTPKEYKKAVKQKCFPKVPIQFILMILLLVGTIFICVFFTVRHIVQKYRSPAYGHRNIYGGNNNFEL